MKDNIENEALIIKNGLTALAKFQSKLDDATWQIDATLIAKFRHIVLHLAIVNGSLARICEKWEHEAEKDKGAANDLTHINSELLQDIIADLLMHATQLSNLSKSNLYGALSQRVTKNIERFAPDSKISLNP